MLSMLQRAKQNGFSVLVVSLDCWTLGWRPADLDNAFFPFIHGTGNALAFSDAVVRSKYEQRAGCRIEDDVVRASIDWVSTVNCGPHAWEEIGFLRQNWQGPIVLKGIQHVDDAKLALATGCDGIVVSNQGGM